MEAEDAVVDIWAGRRYHEGRIGRGSPPADERLTLRLGMYISSSCASFSDPSAQTASIWTEITAPGAADAFEMFAQELETGTVFLNRCDYLDPALAWTGVKDSGRGVSLSKFGKIRSLG